MENVRIYTLPKCKMVSSGSGMFGDGVLEAFDAWFNSFPSSGFPQDFLWFNGKGFVWYYLYKEGMEVPETFEVVDFVGGLYAVATGRDGDENDRNAVMQAIDQFLEENIHLEKDHSRVELGNVITSAEAAAILGYHQMDYYTPIKLVEKK